jgi:hypothetical protein
MTTACYAVFAATVIVTIALTRLWVWAHRRKL